VTRAVRQPSERGTSVRLSVHDDAGLQLVETDHFRFEPWIRTCATAYNGQRFLQDVTLSLYAWQLFLKISLLQIHRVIDRSTCDNLFAFLAIKNTRGFPRSQCHFGNDGMHFVRHSDIHVESLPG
jgi:hypothetical protein